jgi:CobQ/CobB/MinD/ParA nucleotide binding domain
MNDVAMVTGDRRIYWIGGCKGGVGKSMMTSATIDYLLDKGQSVVLVESDTSNPDVSKAYESLLPTEVINLDRRNGWVDLVNICDAHPQAAIVVNTAARNNESVRMYGPTLDQSLEEMSRKLVVLWVINRQRDSLELLREFMQTLLTAEVHVVRNGYFGDESQFELYNESEMRQRVEGKGGKSVTFPDLADRVADDLYTKRLALSTAARVLPIGNRAELGRWRGEVRKVLLQLVA